MKEIDWSKEIKDWASSGISQAAYCRRHGLSTGKFYYYKQALIGGGQVEEQPGQSSFIELQGSGEKEQIELCLGNGVVIRLSSNTPAPRISELVRCLS